METSAKSDIAVGNVMTLNSGGDNEENVTITSITDEVESSSLHERHGTTAVLARGTARRAAAAAAAAAAARRCHGR